MSSGIVQHRCCPRCAIRRTVRLADGSFCYNCRLLWRDELSLTYAPGELAYVFTAHDTARLIMYRSAVQAGFYTDW